MEAQGTTIASSVAYLMLLDTAKTMMSGSSRQQQQTASQQTDSFPDSNSDPEAAEASNPDGAEEPNDRAIALDEHDSWDNDCHDSSFEEECLDEESAAAAREGTNDEEEVEGEESAEESSEDQAERLRQNCREAKMWIEQGRVVYGSWTSTDAGLADFEKALALLPDLPGAMSPDGREAHAVLAEARVWKAKAHQKLKQHEAAQASYQAAVGVLEQTVGHYAKETQEAYWLLSKLAGERGLLQDQLSLGLVAARIEHVRSGPRDLAVRSALQQLLLKEFHSTPELSHQRLSYLEESAALEARADYFLEQGSPRVARELYTEALLLERERMGQEDNANLAVLYRKKAFAKLTPHGAPRQSFEPWDCPSALQDPCSYLRSGDEAFLEGSISEATSLYAQAVDKAHSAVVRRSLLTGMAPLLVLALLGLVKLVLPRFARKGRKVCGATLVRAKASLGASLANANQWRVEQQERAGAWLQETSQGLRDRTQCLSEKARRWWTERRCSATVEFRNLTPKFTKGQLELLVKGFGPIVEIQWPEEKQADGTWAPSVCFAHRASAIRAMSILQGIEIGGLAVKLDWATHGVLSEEEEQGVEILGPGSPLSENGKSVVQLSPRARSPEEEVVFSRIQEEEDHDDQEDKDVASSVISLGKILAEFETNIPESVDVQGDYQRLVPLE